MKESDLMRTVLIKLSGESLAGSYGHGFDFAYMRNVCARIKKIHDKGINVAIVSGGGNFMRGRDAKEMDRERADYIGMMATIMNSLALKDVFLKLGSNVYNQSGLEVSFIDKIDIDKIKEAFAENKIIIFGGGTGKPFFSTDTGAALRAKDIGADMIIKLTNVDGVYDKDPNKYPDALMYDEVTFDEVLAKELGVMDLSAIRICKENNIQIVVANIDNETALMDIIDGKKVGTRVYK